MTGKNKTYSGKFEKFSAFSRFQSNDSAKNTRAITIKGTSQVLLGRTKNSYKQAGEQNVTELSTKLFLGGALIVLKLRENKFLRKNERKKILVSFPMRGSKTGANRWIDSATRI